jgi:hypothetical protein
VGLQFHFVINVAGKLAAEDFLSGIARVARSDCYDKMHFAADKKLMIKSLAIILADHQEAWIAASGPCSRLFDRYFRQGWTFADKAPLLMQMAAFTCSPDVGFDLEVVMAPHEWQRNRKHKKKSKLSTCSERDNRE